MIRRWPDPSSKKPASPVATQPSGSLVEAVVLLVVSDPQADGELGHGKGNHCGNRTPHDGEHHCLGLHNRLSNSTFYSAMGTFPSLTDKHACKDGANDSADTMHAEHVKAVIIA